MHKVWGSQGSGEQFGGVFGMVPPRLGGCTGAPPLQCGTTFRVNYGKLRKHGVICGIDGGILGKQLEIWWGDFLKTDQGQF